MKFVKGLFSEYLVLFSDLLIKPQQASGFTGSLQRPSIFRKGSRMTENHDIVPGTFHQPSGQRNVVFGVYPRHSPGQGSSSTLLSLYNKLLDSHKLFSEHEILVGM